MNELYIDDFNRISNYSKDDPSLLHIFKYPRAHWFTKFKSNLTSSVSRLLKRAGNSTVVLVIYYIPDRDMHGYSKGGAKDEAEYLEFITQFSKGIGQKEVILIVEPDAIPHAINNQPLLLKRSILLDKALKIIEQNAPNAKVYLDIGHPRWVPPEDISGYLAWWSMAPNFGGAPHGFSVNVSNFVPLDECIVYGQVISIQSGYPFVIDTSRNGSTEHDESWCNPPNKKLGTPPTLNTGLKNVDAFLWIKTPGESDGLENSNKPAGAFCPEYAHALINN